MVGRTALQGSPGYVYSWLATAILPDACVFRYATYLELQPPFPAHSRPLDGPRSAEARPEAGFGGALSLTTGTWYTAKLLVAATSR